MAEHEVFKLKREILQFKKVIETQKRDVQDKNKQIVILETDNEQHLQNLKTLFLENEKLKAERNEMQKKQTDPYEFEILKKNLKTCQESLEVERERIRQYEYKYEEANAKLSQLRSQYKELAIKYKEDYRLADDANFRDEVHDNRLKVQKLVEETNRINQTNERLSAENRVLRKMAGVPDDYQFELDDIIQEGQMQVEKYRAQVRQLEKDVEDLEEERARLRRQLREAVAGGDVDDKDDDEGIHKKLKSENYELKKKIDDLQKQVDYSNQQLQQNQGGGGGQNPEIIELISKQQETLKQQMEEVIKRVQEGGGFVSGTQVRYPDQQHQQPGQESIIQQKTQVNTQGLQQMALPPTPIPGAFGNYNDIKDGHSQRFGVKLPVDMTVVYESGLDPTQMKYEIASLQLQNIETLKLLQVKEKEYIDLQNEVQQIKEYLKGQCLLVQDQLFVRYCEEKEKFTLKYEELLQKYKTLQEDTTNIRHSQKKYEEFMEIIRENNPESMQGKLAELTKRTAILDVNLIRMARKYDSLNEEFQQMKQSYLICESTYAEKEKELLEKIYKLIEWKKSSQENIKLLLKQLRNSINLDDYKTTRQQLEKYIALQANSELRESDYRYKIAKLESSQREIYEKSERIRQLEEELVEFQLETEVIKKRLEALDPYFQKYQKVYTTIVDMIKLNNISPNEMFKVFDADGNGKISKQEFSSAIRDMKIPVTDEEMDVLYMFVDLDGTGQIEYPEFIRRLRRSGVQIRKKEDELLYTLYRAINSIGKLTLRQAFDAFDSNRDNVISKQDMMETLKLMQIPFENDAVDYIFRVADTSGDNQISYEEFQVLFDEIVKNAILEQEKGINLELDWKFAIMIKLDQAIKDQRLTILDIFKMIDKDQDQVVSFKEFNQMFVEMDIGVRSDDIRQLFDSMDNDRNGQIIYNEMLAFLREAKREEEKIEKLKALQRRTQELSKEQESDIQLKQLSKNNTLSLESRLQMKISILEMREKHSQERCKLLVAQLSAQEDITKKLSKTIQALQDQMEKSSRTFLQEQTLNNQREIELKVRLPKEQCEKIMKQNEQLHLELKETKAANNTYRTLYETACEQTKSVQLTLEKHKYDQENLQNTIKELQSISESNMTIGKLYHHLMISRWHEAQTNMKYQKLIEELRRLKMSNETYDALVLEKSDEILEQNKIFNEQVQQYEVSITDLKMKMLPTISLNRVEEQAQKIKELSEMKFEVEKQNHELREKFYELQLKADYFDTYKDKLRYLELTLKQQNPDDLSQQIIEVSTKYSDTKMELLKAQRDVHSSKEKEEYYQRLNRQYTDTIKRLEFDLSHADLNLRKREEEWRKKFYEQRKVLFEQLGLQDLADPKEFHKKTVDSAQKLVDIIRNKANIAGEKQEQMKDQEIDSLKKVVQDLQEQLLLAHHTIGDVTKQKQEITHSFATEKKLEEKSIQEMMKKEAEQLQEASQHMLKTMQDLLRDKDEEISRKDLQIERIRGEFALQKKKDLDEIRNLATLLAQKEQNQLQEQIFTQKNKSIHLPEAQPAMMDDFQKILDQKDRKIKTLEINYEAEKKALSKLKDELISLTKEKEQLNIELDLQIKLNEKQQQSEKINNLQKIVNAKNKELIAIQATVKDVKDQLFKISEITIQKEKEFQIKESNLNINNTQLETKLANMIGQIKSFQQQLIEKTRAIEKLQEKEIENKAKIEELLQKNNQLRAVIQMGGGKADEEDQTIANISNKLQQVNKLSTENTQLMKEIQFLKTQQGAKNIFDKDGNLNCSTGLYFRDVYEIAQAIREYLLTKPKFRFLQELRKNDKQFLGLMPSGQLLETLSLIGIRLKPKDQKTLIEALKEKGDQVDYYNKFYYYYMGWSDRSMQTDVVDDQQKQEQPQQVQKQGSQKFSLKAKK